MSAQQDDVPLALRDQFPPEETAVLSGQQAIEQLGPAILPSQPRSNSEEVDNGSEAMIASPSRPWSNLQPSGGRLDMASLGGSLHQGGRPSSACSQTSLDTAASGAVSASSASGRVGHTSHTALYPPCTAAPPSEYAPCGDESRDRGSTLPRGKICKPPRGTSACTTLLHLMILQPGCGLQARALSRRIRVPDLVIGSDFSPSTLALAEAHVGNVPSPHPELGVHQHLFGWMVSAQAMKLSQEAPLRSMGDVFSEAAATVTEVILGRQPPFVPGADGLIRFKWSSIVYEPNAGGEQAKRPHPASNPTTPSRPARGGSAPAARGASPPWGCQSFADIASAAMHGWELMG